ncbi:hypothetical protein BDZ91DRAFT_790106 [Kalaharituber pfeilii]|nr:hypothetical protein BDZ91DRAFT_790106 [Kalaharituber pfeilii]
MATGIQNSNAGEKRFEDVSFTLTKMKPKRKKHETPIKDLTNSCSTIIGTSGKNETSKATVTDMKIFVHWDVLDDNGGGVAPTEPFREHLRNLGQDGNNGRAEIAIYLRVIPLPGSTLEILHLNRNMYPKLGTYRAIPLLPDGTSPRRAAGPTALGIPVVSGRYRRPPEGKVKFKRNSTSQNSNQEDMVIVDGTYDSDEVIGTGSGVTHNSPLDEDLFLDGESSYLNVNNEDVATEGKQIGNEADQWLECYNSGTQLTENASGYLCINFDESMRRDALVIEIYLEAEPIKLDEAPHEESCFLFAGLPYCKSGIGISFMIRSTSNRHEWTFQTTPALSGAEELGNTICGTYHSSGIIGDTSGNVLIIRTRRIEKLQTPRNYAVEVISKCMLLPYLDQGYVGILYNFRLVLNGIQALEPEKYSKLSFRIERVQKGDTLDCQECPEAEIVDEGDGYMSLEIPRPASETFRDVNLTILTRRRLEFLSIIEVPKFIPVNGFTIAETVLLEELGDQPLSYSGLDSLKIWRNVAHEEKSKKWTNAYQLIEINTNANETFEFGLKIHSLGYTLPGSEVFGEDDNDIVDLVSYTIFPATGTHSIQSFFTVKLTIAYDVKTLKHNERVFTVATKEWDYSHASFNGRLEAPELFQRCDEARSKWVVLNNCIGTAGGDTVFMESSWIGKSKVVLMNQDGEIIECEEGSEGNKSGEARSDMHSVETYECLEVPYVLDRWVCVDCKINWERNEMLEIPQPSTPVSSRASDMSASMLLTQSQELFSYSPSNVYQDFLASRAPGRSRTQRAERKSHLCRGTLKGEVYRDESLYITRKGVRIYIYVPQSEVIGIRSRGGIHDAKVFNQGGAVILDPPKPGLEGRSQSEKRIRLSKINTGKEALKGRTLRGGKAQEPTHNERTIGHGIAFQSFVVKSSQSMQSSSQDVLVDVASFDSQEVASSSLIAAPKISLDSTQSITLSKDRTIDNVNGEHTTKKAMPITLEVERSMSSAKRKRQSQCTNLIVSNTAEEHKQGAMNNTEKTVEGNAAMNYSIIPLITSALAFVITLFAIHEVKEVRSEIGRLKDTFENAYGYLEDVRWRRLRIQEEEYEVMIRGRSLEGHDCLKEFYCGENMGGSQDERDNSAVYDDLFEEVLQVEELTDNVDTNHHGVAVAKWTQTSGLQLFPWCEVKRVIDLALDKSWAIAQETKHVAKDSWNKFLRAWKAVWYMT